jgi:hypothetical protein
MGKRKKESINRKIYSLVQFVFHPHQILSFPGSDSETTRKRRTLNKRRRRRRRTKKNEVKQAGEKR